jgi:glycine/D-amino acid oxidase-like deaminating enzyme
MTGSGAAPDVIIIGAGVVGAACALECVRSGLRTTVVERDIVAGGATGAAMGHIVVMDDSEPQLQLTRYSQALWRELVPELPASVEYDPCGTLWVAAGEQELQAVREKEARYRAIGVRVEMLDAASLQEAEPQLRAGLAGGLQAPDDFVIYPPAAAKYLLERALDGGAALIAGTAVAAIGDGDLRLANGATLAGGLVINASGANLDALSPGAGVRKRKGHLVITDRYPGFLRHQTVELGYLKSTHAAGGDAVAFNVQPRATGQLLIGSSRQYGIETTKTDAAILGAMLGRAMEFLPRLGALSAIRAWAGFRPATADNLPLIGPSPTQPRVLVAGGHEGLGITMSLATARLLVDGILGRRPAISPAPYVPARVKASRTSKANATEHAHG